MSHGADLRVLLDIEEIKRLKARYFRCLDTKDWEDLAGVFASDVHMEVPEADLVLDGRDTVVESLSTVLAGTVTVHHGHTPEIEIIDAHTATGIWAMADYVEFPSDDDASVGLRGYGHYRETYRREDGEWRIATLRLDRLRIDPLD